MKHLRKAAFLSVLLVLLLAGAAQATLQWTNNAASVLASDITAGTLSITVTTGHGDRFPEVAAPHYFMATLVDTSGNREIVKVTARTSGSNTMTITRAQEGTSARSFATGSIVELRITKNAMDLFSRSVDIHENHYVVDASAADQGATTNSRSLKSLVDALGATEEATLELPHTGTGDTTTYTVGTNLTIPATVTLRAHKGVRISPSTGVTLTVNGIVQAGAFQIFAGAGTVTVSTYPQDQAWWGSAQRLDGSMQGFSANATAMRATADPYPAGSESLATTLLGELQRIRYVIAQITGETYWYQDPDTTIAALNQGQNPPGTVLPYAGASAPTGYLLCYGQAVSRTTYAALFAIIGETYGAGDATTTFNVPDLRGRFPLGKDDMGGSSANRVTDTDADTLGGADGDETKALNHDHTYNTVIAHSHTITVEGNTANNTPTYISGGSTTVGSANFNTSSTGSASGTTASGGSATQDIMPPFVTLNYIIKY